MKLERLFMEFKQGLVYQTVVKLEDVYVKNYLKILWTSLANLAISLDLSVDILKEIYKPKEPILIKVDDELYIQARLVTIVKNNLILSLSKILPTPDELKVESFRTPSSYENLVHASICLDGDCVEGSLAYIDDDNLHVSMQGEKIAEFSQKLTSKGIGIKDILNKSMDTHLTLPDGSRFKGKGKLISINLYENEKLNFGIGKLSLEEGSEAFRTYLKQRRKEIIQALANL